MVHQEIDENTPYPSYSLDSYRVFFLHKQYERTDIETDLNLSSNKFYLLQSAP